jgi:hypothetical protein
MRKQGTELYSIPASATGLEQRKEELSFQIKRGSVTSVWQSRWLGPFFLSAVLLWPHCGGVWFSASQHWTWPSIWLGQWPRAEVEVHRLLRQLHVLLHPSYASVTATTGTCPRSSLSWDGERYNVPGGRLSPVDHRPAIRSSLR